MRHDVGLGDKGASREGLASERRPGAGRPAVRQAGVSLSAVAGSTRREFAGAAAVAVAGVMAACGGVLGPLPARALAEGESSGSPQGPAASEGSSPLARALDAGDVAPLLAAMTRRQKVCQMLMPDFRQWRMAGQEEESDLVVLNDEVAGLIDAYGFGGVILFANNVVETRQTWELTHALQAAAVRNSAGDPGAGIPLLLGIDQEGGIVYRLGSGCAMPGNMALGAARSVDLARGCGEVMARELGVLGINVDFAPVVDVNDNPNNPVIGLRSFSDRASLVAELGCAMVEGIQGRGVAAAAKHFPGHGDAATDSHTGLPRIDKTLDELRDLEFVPFQAAFEAGVDMVMTAHIQFPLVETEAVQSVDPAMGQICLPATLSHTFLTDILRGELGFEGVAVTDALNMDAVAANFASLDAVRRAVLAGADIALMPQSLRSLDDVAALDDLVDALVRDPEITDARLDESVGRILRLKLRRGILELAWAGEGTNDGDSGLEAALAEVGCEANRAFEREAAARAATVVRGEGLLPFRPVAGQRVLLVAAYENERPGMELAMRRLVAEGVLPEGVMFDSVCYAGDDASAEAVEAAARYVEGLVPEFDFVVAISEVGRAANLSTGIPSFSSGYVPARVAAAGQAAGVPVVVMSIAKPYDLALYPAGCALVAVYGNKGMDPTEGLAPSHAFGPNVPAGVEAIFAGHAVAGKLPVDVFAASETPDGTPFIDMAQLVYAFGAGEEYPAV